jgi:hypothetical protein
MGWTWKEVKTGAKVGNAMDTGWGDPETTVIDDPDDEDGRDTNGEHKALESDW